MDCNTNEEGLRDSVFNTINLLTEIESGDRTSQREQGSVANRQEADAGLSNQFVSGIKDKLLDPSKLEKLQNGQASEVEQLKYNMHRNLEQLKTVIDSQNEDIAELKSFIGSLKQELGNLKNAQVQVQQQAQKVMVQQSVEQPAMQQPQSFVQPQMQQPHSFEQPQMQQQQRFAPAVSTPVNPRVGHYESADVSIEKYFYCGK